MTLSSRFFVLVGYWGAMLLLHSLNWALYRGFRRYEAWEIREAYPQHKRALAALPWAEIVPTLLLVAVLFLVWTADFLDGELPGHVLGLFYGLMLLATAIFSRITGVHALHIFQRTTYVIETGRTWHGTLQLALASIYMAVPVVFLLISLA